MKETDKSEGKAVEEGLVRGFRGRGGWGGRTGLAGRCEGKEEGGGYRKGCGWEVRGSKERRRKEVGGSGVRLGGVH